MSKADVVITGYGLVSPLGNTIEAFKEGLFEGKSGVRSLRSHMVSDDFPVPYAAYVQRKELPPTKLYGLKDGSSVMKSWLMTAVAT